MRFFSSIGLVVAALLALSRCATADALQRSERLSRRADQVVLSWPLQRKQRGSSGSVFSFAASVDIQSDWNGGMAQQGFALIVDTGSDKTWVMSNLIPTTQRHVGRVYYPPQYLHEQHEAGTLCDIATYEYGAGLIRVANFKTTVTIGRAMSDFSIGAAFEINGRFQTLSSAEFGDGIVGMSPSGASTVVSKLGLDARTQFLFDAQGERLSFGDFSSSLLWLPGSVTGGDVDKWIIPASLTNIGRVHVDTGFSAIVLRPDLLKFYFQLYPEGTWREDSGRYLISCDDAGALPPLTIHFFGRENDPSSAQEGGLTAKQLSGSYKYARDGKRWCLTPLAELTDQHVSPAMGDIGAALGEAWFVHYQVAFDSHGQRVGVRPAPS